MKPQLAAVVIIGTAMALIIQSLGAQVPALPNLTGSWQLTLIPNVAATAAPPVAPIPGLATFTSDGSVVETDGTEVVPLVSAEMRPLYGTQAHGIWQPGPAISRFFVQFISLFVNQNATLHAKKTVTITGGLDSTGNNFSGSYSFELVDSTGHVLATGSGNVSGQKIPHPLLP